MPDDIYTLLQRLKGNQGGPTALLQRPVDDSGAPPSPPPLAQKPEPVDTEMYMGPPTGPGDPEGVKNYLARNAPPPDPQSDEGRAAIDAKLPPNMKPLIYDTKLSGATLGRQNAIEGAQQQEQLDQARQTPDQQLAARVMEKHPDLFIKKPGTREYFGGPEGIYRGDTGAVVPGTAKPLASKLLTPDELAQQIQLRKAGRQDMGGEGIVLKGNTPEERLASVPPNVKEKVNMLLGYKVDATPYMLTRNADWAAASEAASQIDPTWNAAEYPSRLKLLNDFKSGKAATSVRSLNTVISHLDVLDKAFKQLSNYDTRAINTVGNAILKQTGSGRTEPFDIAANAVANEAATVFKNTSGTDQEIKAWRESLSPSMGPKDWESAKKTFLNLLAGRIGYLDSQFHTGMGKPRDFRLLSPQAAAIVKQLGGGQMDELGSEPQGGGPAAGGQGGGDGQTATGPNGHKIVVKGGRWVDAQTGAPIQ